jgi:hypothetical protein
MEGGTEESTARASVTSSTRLTRATKRRRGLLHEINGRYWARTSDPQLVDTTAGFVAGFDSLTVLICTR